MGEEAEAKPKRDAQEWGRESRHKLEQARPQGQLPMDGGFTENKELTLHFEAIAPLENFARSFSGHWFRRKSLLVISLPHS